MTMASRPLTKVERRKFNRAQHEKKIREDLIGRHGNDLGNFLSWLRIMSIQGTQRFRDGDTSFIRDVALALENVYRRHNS
ncbi:hypothetical protein ACFRAA_33335 [[Kitasatospora] papulosa]|uniref:hypothetical protein n=1 Tax=Streptomyces TaxID=1883 RepID=UPI0029C03148|nr:MULTISPECIES: hypothetical protein [unclassified Streptomyces]MEE1774903.1 hypothetical protein [Streptomyces sp. JV181]